MKVIERQSFDGIIDRQPKRLFCDVELRKCDFSNCGLSIIKDVKLRSTVRNVRLIDCTTFWSDPGTAIIEEVLVEGLRTRNLLQTWGAVFKHVTLQGKIGDIMLSGTLCPTSTTTTSMQRAIREANSAYYSTVDWALDISRAEFVDCDIRGIPSRLIRRDPETQAVVTRERAVEGRWRELDLSKTHWDTAIDFLLKESGAEHDPDTVLVAPKRSPKFRDLLDGIKLLRREGIAEPD